MTLMQAFKVWWSYSWRASILVIPITMIMTVWSLWGIIPVIEDSMQSGKGLDIEQLMGLATGGMGMMLLSVALITLVQILAMRWTLNSRWSDFRLKAVPPDAEVGNAPGAGGSGTTARV